MLCFQGSHKLVVQIRWTGVCHVRRLARRKKRQRMRQVAAADIVLRVCKGVFHIEHQMPPPSRNEDRLTRATRALDDGAAPGVHRMHLLVVPQEPGHDRLGLLHSAVGQDGNAWGSHVRRKEQPALAAENDRVPCRRVVGVNVEVGASTRRPAEQPPTGVIPALG